MSTTAMIVCIFLINVMFLTFLGKRISSKGQTNFIEDLQQSEREANFARRKEIDPALFFTADLSVLPPIAPDDKTAAKVAAQAAKTMIHFKTPMTNIELKKAYGPGQLENIVQYEENYQDYIRSLLDWAEDLIEKNKKTEALQVLENTIALGSEYRKSYTLTADLYAGDKKKLLELQEVVKNHRFSDPYVQKKIMDYIKP